MESISEDSDRVGQVTPQEFYAHEEEGHTGYAEEFAGDLLVLLVHSFELL